MRGRASAMEDTVRESCGVPIKRREPHWPLCERRGQDGLERATDLMAGLGRPAARPISWS